MGVDRNSDELFLHKIWTSADKEIFVNIDWHTIALNSKETHIFLVGHHELALIPVEKLRVTPGSTPREEANLVTTSISDIKLLPLFDTSNVNKPIVQWNPFDEHQYAVAIDRLVRFYNVDNGKPHDTSVYIDSQHQRPISTVCYSPQDQSHFLTGSLDGQILLWDIRCTVPRGPAALKLHASTMIPIRSLQWCPNGSSDIYKLAVQCDRCIRLYDIRRTDKTLPSSIDLEHTQRIIGMDWTTQNRSVFTLSNDQSIRAYAPSGQLLAESMWSESSYVTTKLCATTYDKLFVCAVRDINSAKSGFMGWRWDEDQLLKPFNDRITTVTRSPIVDFCLVKKPNLSNLLFGLLPNGYHESTMNQLLLLTWCRDRQLSLICMDSTFRQAYHEEHFHATFTNQKEYGHVMNAIRLGPPIVRTAMHRNSVSVIPMESIKDERVDGLSDDHCFEPISTSPPNIFESADSDDEIDYQSIPDRNNNTVKEVSIENEFGSLLDSYGSHIIIEAKDAQRRICVVRCIYSIDRVSFFRIYLILSPNYPTISQLLVRFKMVIPVIDDRLKSFQNEVQQMFDSVSHAHFFRGQLCLHDCMTRLKTLLEHYHKQQKIREKLAMSTAQKYRSRELSRNNSDYDSSIPMSANNYNGTLHGNSNRLFSGSSSSPRTTDSLSSSTSLMPNIGRTCGARFSGPAHLLCFGRISSSQAAEANQILTSSNDKFINRTQSLPMRSASIMTSNSRENSITDEQQIHYPITNNIQIQSTSNSQRTPIFSAPVCSSIIANNFNENSRTQMTYRRSVPTLTPSPSIVAIYDVSILLPVNQMLAEKYNIDLKNSLDMCKTNQTLTNEMAKSDLAHSWRLLGGLISIQPDLKPDDPWFQTPIAQGLIKHLVTHYAENFDIQSSSMFLLAMSETPYLKTQIESKSGTEHDHDSILYGYASLLHRWKHFYKRTQILSQIDQKCQSPPIPSQQSTSIIICSLCSQPVMGQYFLCAACAHGGHLLHMHDWFSSDEPLRRYCPERNCSCRCIVRQQELVQLSTFCMQQQQTTPNAQRSNASRQSLGSIRPL